MQTRSVFFIDIVTADLKHVTL